MKNLAVGSCAWNKLEACIWNPTKLKYITEETSLGLQKSVFSTTPLKGWRHQIRTSTKLSSFSRAYYPGLTTEVAAENNEQLAATEVADNLSRC